MKLRSITKAALTLALGVMASAAMAQRSDINPLNYAESFEGDPGGFWANGVPRMAVTNGWYSSVTDQSYVTNMTYSYAGISPISSAAHTRVLKLNTEGVTLTNDLVNTSFASKLYVDTMVNFVVSEDYPSGATSPSNDRNVKVATFLHASGGSTNLVIYHGTGDGLGDFLPARYTSTTNLVADTWYRLTITLDALPGFYAAEALQVKINGTPISSAAAYGDNWKADYLSGLAGGGTWFLSAARGPDGDNGADLDKITALGFQGTGFIDDLVVTADDPFGTPSSGITFLLSANQGAANGTISLATDVQIDQGDSTNIVFTADDWYRIDSLTTNSVAVSGAAGLKTFTLEIEDMQTAVDAVVAFTQPVTMGGINTAWQSQWGTEAEVAAGDLDMYDLATEYLLNTDPTVTEVVTFKIDSITSSGGDVQVVVSLNVVPNPGTAAINGTLKLYKRASLTSGTWEEAASTTLGMNDTQTFTFSGQPADLFYKAVIE